jgi:hypothetical protein
MGKDDKTLRPFVESYVAALKRGMLRSLREKQ